VAVQKGALVPHVLSAFDARPEKTLSALPDSVCKSFSIPRPGQAFSTPRLGTQPLGKSLREIDMEDFEEGLKRDGLWRTEWTVPH
jgi:hypothetical protein